MVNYQEEKSAAHSESIIEGRDGDALGMARRALVDNLSKISEQEKSSLVDNLSKINKQKNSAPKDHFAYAKELTEGDVQCPVCGANHSTCQCPDCGFDGSCDYEHYPTLQILDKKVPAISALKEEWKASQIPTADRALSVLRAQGWEEHVLSAVEKILRRAEDGRFTKQHLIEIYDKEKTVSGKPHTKATRYCAICGTKNSNDNLYCLKCGVKLSAFNIKTTEQKTGTAEGQSSKPSKFCKYCGKAVKAGTIYCAHCGVKIG